MNRMYKGFAAGLLIVIAALVPACRSSKKDNPPKVTTAATDTIPDVPTTTTVAQRVDTAPPDFVNDADRQPTSELLPSDVEQLNVVAQQRGFIRDAFFGYDESALSSDAQAALSSSASWLRGAGSSYNLLIEGHCDERGTEQYNLALGDRRANIVREYLVTLGVEAGRIRTVSYGEERPFDEGHDESAWAKNRRAHLVLVAR
jgi:peptidoglycan-associated lipoprotein